MKAALDVRLQRLLGGDGLAALRKRLRRHYELAPLHDIPNIIRITKLKLEEHAVLASMLGRPQRYANSMQVDITLIDAGLRRSGIAPSLRHALEELDGPIVHLAAARLQSRMLWADVIAGCNHPRLMQLLEMPASFGLLKRLAKQQPSAAAQLCRRAEAVLRHLPAKGITRSQLAASALGDAHALDNGQATATLTLAVWRLAAQPDSSNSANISGEAAESSGAGERNRDVWASAGVLVNELARPALFLNLPAREGKNYGQPAGEPVHASLRTLLRSPPSWDVADRDVHICENPNLLAIAADHLGRNCAPLVCVDGMPGAAQRCLLAQLARAGARLLYHGDFDWPGLRIGNCIMRQHGAKPWRYGAADYMTAVDASSSLGHPLAGRTVDALWDDALATRMRQHGVAIAEEALAASLLPDLGLR